MIRMEMHGDTKSVLLVSMPFAGVVIPSIQLPVLEGYLKQRDISVATKHLYLKAAEFYGLQNYDFLIYPPNEPYTAQMVFSKYVFPDHWKTTEDKCREYFNKNLVKNEAIKKEFSFDEYLEKTDKFYKWATERIEWRSYDLIGFTLNYGQLLPSLAIAKKIKETDPDKKIVFGGSRTVAPLGLKVLEAFDYVDFIVSGEGEEPLFRLTAEHPDYKSIPRLIYRNEGKVLWNNSDCYVDIDTLPIPSYDSFFEELKATSAELQQVFYQLGRLPVEISRGCWWNRCSFCNQKIVHPSYREKSADRFVKEIQQLSDRYKIVDFQLIGSTLPKDHRLFLNKIIELNKDYTFVAEARAAQLKSSDYTLLKNAGFHIIQTGIESFSASYLKKMKKGVKVIDNIAALKFCKENGITNFYNIIIGYPNEEPIDFEETIKTTNLFKHYLDPPNICNLRVVYGSEIYNNPELFNIEALSCIEIDSLMYPKEFLEKEFAFVYDFKRKQELGKHDWVTMVDEWKKQREALEIQAIKKQTAIDKLIFYFVDGGTFIKIYDKRSSQNIKIYVLDDFERKIFLACIDVVSYNELQEQFPDIPDFKLAATLDTFEQSGIVYREEKYYLSLPLTLIKHYKGLNVAKSEKEHMIPQIC